MASERRVDELRVQATYDRERRDLYRAKSYGPRPTSPARLRELERACQLSEERLALALRSRGADPGKTPAGGSVAPRGR